MMVVEAKRTPEIDWGKKRSGKRRGFTISLGSVNDERRRIHEKGWRTSRQRMCGSTDRRGRKTGVICVEESPLDLALAGILIEANWGVEYKDSP